MEKSNIVYGRLSEATHIAGYTFERAIGELKWLLQEERWKEVGEGFDDISYFMQSISFAEFKIAIEQRKEVAKMLTNIGASQRQTAKVLGVTHTTVQRDTGINVPPEEKTDIEYEDVTEDSGTNMPPTKDIAPAKDWFEKEGTKVAEREQKTVHVSNNSGENEWYTPIEIIESARAVMGSIDLDPATSLLANESVKAEQIFTKGDNGLRQEWNGNIWMNPPYSQPLIKEFSDKIVSELENQSIEQACVLTNNATETEWYQQMMQRCSAVCFIKSRLKFIDYKGNPSGAPLQGQTIMYFGKRKDEFAVEFNKYGICMEPIR